MTTGSLRSNGIPSRDGGSLAVTRFLFWGLFSLWAYTAYSYLAALKRHFEACRSVALAGYDALPEGSAASAALDRIVASGLTFDSRVGSALAAVLTAALVLVLFWFSTVVYAGIGIRPVVIVVLVAASSALFVLGVTALLVISARALRAHELALADLDACRSDPQSLQQLPPSSNFVQKWEQRDNRVLLFGIFAATAGAAPTVCVWWVLFDQPSAAAATIMVAAVFLAAVVFHAWGTRLLVDLYNDHLQGHTVGAHADAAVKSGGEPAKALSTPKRELAAIMLTDIVGYSRSMERDENQAYLRLMDHNGIMRACIAKYGGREIKTMGDAFLVLFRSATDAVDCAISVQNEFSTYNTGRSSSEHTLVRIGVHIGDVLVSENDVHGDGINVAARIEPLAEPGGICISEDVYNLVKKKLSFEVERVDGVTLKNINHPPSLFRIRPTNV